MDYWSKSHEFEASQGCCNFDLYEYKQFKNTFMKKNMHNLKVLKWWLPFDYDVPISTLSLKVFIPAYMKILTKIMTMPLNNMKSKNFTRHYVPPLLNEHIIKKTDELSQNKVCVIF